MIIAHVALWTADLDAAAAFWRDFFAAEVGEEYVSRNRPGFRSRFVRFPSGGAALELMSGPWIAGTAEGERPGWAHVALSLGSRDAVIAAAERFAAAGLLVSGPRTTGDGFFEALLRTPDGAAVEITS